MSLLCHIPALRAVANSWIESPVAELGQGEKAPIQTLGLAIFGLAQGSLIWLFIKPMPRWLGRCGQGFATLSAPGPGLTILNSEM